MKLLKFLPVQITIFMTLGIFTGFYFSLPTQFITLLLLFGLACLFLFYYLVNRSYHKEFLFTIIALFLSFLIGFATINFMKGENNRDDYSHFLKKTNKVDLSILKVLKPSTNYYKYLAKIQQINNYFSTGKIILSIIKDSVSTPLIIGNHIYTSQKIKTIQQPLNPYIFNYKNYLKKKNITHQIIIKNSHGYLKLKTTKFSFAGLAAKLRKKIEKKLLTYHIKPDEMAVINALLLGQRQNISTNLLRNYANAGALHILAISGLHIGILLVLLNFLFKPIGRFKNGENLKLILLIFILWTYAFIAGMSASVVRAVTMFTAVAIGLSLKRATNVYNTLFTSMFILLLFNPYYIFDVGFQLSYSAVFAIVWIQPLLDKLWQPNVKVISYFWKLTTVSIAAQLGILPLSLYYFHQFPGLFIISNLVIIPVLGILLGVGLILIFTILFINIPSFLVDYYVELIHWLNQFITWIASKNQFLITQISFSLIMMVASYLVIISIIYWFSTTHKKQLFYVLGSILILQSILFYTKYEQQQLSNFIVFQQYKKTLLAVENRDSLLVISNFLSKNTSTIINAYKLENDISKTFFTKSIRNIYSLANNYLLVIDSSKVYKLKNLVHATILLRQSPQINLERLINRLHPKQIIADGSNYKTYLDRWNKTCTKYKTPFFNTSLNGAIIIATNKN